MKILKKMVFLAFLISFFCFYSLYIHLSPYQFGKRKKHHWTMGQQVLVNGHQINVYVEGMVLAYCSSLGVAVASPMLVLRSIRIISKQYKVVIVEPGGDMVIVMIAIIQEMWWRFVWDSPSSFASKYPGSVYHSVSFMASLEFGSLGEVSDSESLDWF